MKLTMLNFPYCNLAHLGEKFGIEIPGQDERAFSELNAAVMMVLSTDSKIRSQGKFDWNSPLGLENTEAQKVEAFQACIRIMRENQISSDNKTLTTAAASLMESILIVDTKIPANAKPEEIKETLKKTIEAVVDSLKDHKMGIRHNLGLKPYPEKSAAIGQLAVLRLLARTGNIDDFTELKNSLRVMQAFEQSASEKYSDYKSNLSTLNSLMDSIESHNSIQKQAATQRAESLTGAAKLKKPESTKPNAEVQLEKNGMVKSSTAYLKRAASRFESTLEEEQSASEKEERQLEEILAESKASADAAIAARIKASAEEERQIKIALESSVLEKEIPSPNLSTEDTGLTRAIAESLIEEAARSKAKPYDQMQVESALKKYEERSKHDPESQHSDRVQISHIGISSEANLRRRNQEHSLEEISALDIHKNQLVSIQFTDFINSREKDIFLCPYLTGSDEVDSHWKLLRFEKEQGRITMMTIDPLGVCHETEEVELLNALQEAITAATGGGVYMETEKTPGMLQLQERGNNTECGPVICYIADQIAQGILLQNIPKVDTETLRIDQGHRDKGRPITVML
jgi:hypothetical protein